MGCLADDGRLVVIAVQGGVSASLDAGVLMRKRLTLTGSTLRARSVAFKAVIAEALKSNAWPLMASGAIKPVVHKVFEAHQACAAHTLMESGQHIGKLVLEWRENTSN
jgi:NADPH2:quinone reductase